MTSYATANTRQRILALLNKISGGEYDVVMVEGGCLVQCVGPINLESVIAAELIKFHKTLPNPEAAFPFQIYSYLTADDAFVKKIYLLRESLDLEWGKLPAAPSESSEVAVIRSIDFDSFSYRVLRPFVFQLRPIAKSNVRAKDWFRHFTEVEIGTRRLSTRNFSAVKLVNTLGYSVTFL